MKGVTATKIILDLIHLLADDDDTVVSNEQLPPEQRLE